MDSQVVENKLDKKRPTVQTPRSHMRLKPILCMGEPEQRRIISAGSPQVSSGCGRSRQTKHVKCENLPVCLFNYSGSSLRRVACF